MAKMNRETLIIEHLGPQTGGVEGETRTSFTYPAGDILERENELVLAILAALNHPAQLEIHPIAGTIERYNTATTKSLIATFTTEKR